MGCSPKGCAPAIGIIMTPNALGSLWMVAAMAGFSVEDMFLKSAARELPVGQILMIFGAGGMVCLRCSPRGGARQSCTPPS